MLNADQRKAISDEEQLFKLKKRTGESAKETKRLQERMERKWEMEKAADHTLQGQLKKLN